jgi:predicted RecB family nuclease
MESATMSFPISKTYFLAGLHCPKRLWLSICRPEDASPMSLAAEQRIKQGKAIGVAARESFKNGILVDGSLKYCLEKSWELTVVGAGQGVECLFEPAFLYDDILVRCDVLRRLPSENWEIIEVKSATKLKDEHIADLTLQHYVLEGLGLTVEKTSLMVVNPMARNWSVVQDRFCYQDVTAAVMRWRGQLPQKLAEFRTLLTEPAAPQVPIGSHCDRPYRCPFKDHCWQNVPPISILDIPLLKQDKLQNLMESNIWHLEDIPAEFPLTQKQRSFIDRMTAAKPQIDQDLLKRLLGQIQLNQPLYFFDVETHSSAIPRFAGLHPYERCIFQYSCHRLNLDGSLEHFEYLHTENSDPRLPLLISLIHHIGDRGSVVVYNQSFEKGVLQQLAAAYPNYGAKINQIIDRLWDLQVIFKKAYFHPGFRGSYSLKKVLPVMAPHLCHDNLVIKSGNEAPLVWEALLECSAPDRRAEMAQQLREYCGLDTLGMVEIYQALQRELKD